MANPVTETRKTGLRSGKARSDFVEKRDSEEISLPLLLLNQQVILQLL
jgi:hypothetical protein